MRKFFEEPIVEVTVLAVEDVIATSADECPDNYGGGEF